MTLRIAMVRYVNDFVVEGTLTVGMNTQVRFHLLWEAQRQF